jgi:thiopeptide-type bacteriocin biosynthesis protein
MTALARFRQYNVSLVRSAGAVHFRSLFLPLARFLAAAGARVRRWFFMRKPPDVRLRVQGDAALHAELAMLLDRLATEGSIRDCRVCVYEPQEHSFGGKAGMALAHRQFHADSRAWLSLCALDTTLPPELISLHVLNDLFASGLEGADEVCEVWHLLGRMQPPAEGPRFELQATSRFLAALTLPARAVLTALLLENRAIGRRLSALHLRGALSSGQRALLARLGQFHFNRWGVRRASSVIASALAILNPERSPRALGASAFEGDTCP